MVSVSSESHSSSSMTSLIHPISKDTVHKICSGQVVTTLTSAVKELIENSIDANATVIDINLKDEGSTLIEVVDNGTGIHEDNFQSLTLKHYTSKIKQFSDLVNVKTLGFRGEALSSLCALADVTVITKHSLAELGSKITYDYNGKIKSKVVCARERGTTIILETLFRTLPVRRKQLLKNIKREFHNMCQLLYAYCLVSKGIKFSCHNLTNRGVKNKILSTDGLMSVKSNIVDLFGVKQASHLVDVELVQPNEEILQEYGFNPEDHIDIQFSFEFIISGLTEGGDRNSNDRQFYFVNSRPWESNKIMKLINEIYKQYKPNHFPFVFLNVMCKSSMVDVNLTPDKKQICLQDEKLLLATIKASLLKTLNAFPSTFRLQNLDLSQCNKNENRGMKRYSSDGDAIRKGSILNRFQKRSKTENDRQNTLKDFSFTKEKTSKHSSCFLDESIEEINEALLDVTNDEKGIEIKVDEETQNEDSKKHNKITKIQEIKIRCDEKEAKERDILLEVAHKLLKENKKPKAQKSFVLDAPKNKSMRKRVTFRTTMEEIKKNLNKFSSIKDENVSEMKFKSEITPECNELAEQELQRQIHKEDFKSMEIIGQFNHGFIITKLKNDLFIIDQHATDERYNFEDLQKNSVLETQVLVNPLPLELSAANESLLIDNLEVFRKNGFLFRIDEEALCTKRIQLISLPLGKNFLFGRDDIDEMLVMLKGSNYKTCRPSRIKAMFASRACRKSVMIGKALSFKDMRKLVDHMGEIDEPWTCAHGRPTMRHLANLFILNKCD